MQATVWTGMMRFFDLFPAPPGLGYIPCWGYGDVVQSKPLFATSFLLERFRKDHDFLGDPCFYHLDGAPKNAPRAGRPGVRATQLLPTRGSPRP